MNSKIKRLFIVVAGVIVSIVIGCFLIQYAQNKNIEKSLERCKSFEGIWTDETGEFELEIRRMTLARMVVTARNTKTKEELAFLAANSTGENSYQFTYSVKGNETDGYEVFHGTQGKGYIKTEDSGVVVDIPEIARYSGCVPEFSGTLTQKKSFEDSSVHLLDYMGSTEEVSEGLLKYCAFERDENGKIWRIHTVYDENLNSYYETDLAGISKVWFEQDCEDYLGKPEETYELGSNRKAAHYEDDKYRYYITYTPYGMVSEVDVCLKEREGMKWDGEFLMKDDTIIRFIGSYEINDYEEAVIHLPKNAKKIATGAFYTDNNDYNKKYVSCRYLTIPKGVTIEKDAFAHCGMLGIELEEGWTVIPEESFAHMVPVDEMEEKIGWVDVELPESIEKIEKMAFALEDGSEAEEKVFKNKLKKMDGVTAQGYEVDMPYLVVVSFWNENWVKEIEVGENALWGCEVW